MSDQWPCMDRVKDQCGNCVHWKPCGPGLPNLGRCKMAEPHVPPMMNFDDYCCDHRPNGAMSHDTH